MDLPPEILEHPDPWRKVLPGLPFPVNLQVRILASSFRYGQQKSAGIACVFRLKYHSDWNALVLKGIAGLAASLAKVNGWYPIAPMATWKTLVYAGASYS